MIKAMNQIPEIKWEAAQVPFNEWVGLDQLWLLMTSAAHEFSISYCYGEPKNPPWLQFTALTEMRFPITGPITATSRLSDRPVVARPNQPIHLPSGEHITLFVGTTLWLELTRGRDLLLDLPLARLSDTWFGPNTREGEVCYACPTHARLSMEGIAANPYKAITPVEIRNQADSPLVMDQFNLPVPYLALYRDDDRHWTSKVTITRTSADSRGEVKIATSAPPFCRSPVELSVPRRRSEGGMIHKALNLLLG
ncbi:MAG TPA: hypothetical protein VJ998_03575 [Pseudomonadales bacterium]|nr:hypothetical protein [Pseudomonadales bacterium]